MFAAKTDKQGISREILFLPVISQRLQLTIKISSHRFRLFLSSYMQLFAKGTRTMVYQHIRTHLARFLRSGNTAKVDVHRKQNILFEQKDFRVLPQILSIY